MILCYSTDDIVGAETATESVLLKSCSEKFRNIRRKTPALESLFDKVAGLGLSRDTKICP